MSVSLRTKYLGLDLKNPVVASANRRRKSVMFSRRINRSMFQPPRRAVNFGRSCSSR